ncbi:phosphatase PAP2 family protein [Parasulfitobacter algicola]|uniref:Phosphatase PAP2 family protein n=1 Tax=Parasulfitobacter algicola TaxID=2614809 RepID=A0ABX2ILP6_9RHOB|nr:phosphatase PAP2 family protein [Sulfitobacter algicola]NSX53779.1 phosphatase PAP2 family protein [Sulfitobacter algicola]
MLSTLQSEWRFRLGVGAAFGLWFGLIYGGTNFITHFRSDLPSLRIPLDDAIPLIPEFSIFYLSAMVFFCLPLLIMPKRNLLVLAYALSVQVLIAGICYLMFPLQPNSYDPPANIVFQIADFVNLTYNDCPSLHVALTASFAMGMWPFLRTVWKPVIAIWALLIIASTLLTHQHHILDVAGGLVLAVFGLKVLLPMVDRRFAHFAMHAE